MDDCALYQRRARECAILRDRARTELGRARLDREHADWIALAERAGQASGLRVERSWMPKDRADASIQ